MRYQVTALVDAARVVTIPVDANDVRGAREHAQRLGYAVLGVRRALAPVVFRAGEHRFPLQLFIQELRLMLEAGLTLPEALQALVEKEAHEGTRRVHEAVRDGLLQGASLSAALSRRPDAFPELFVASVRASEKTGDLAEALGRHLTYLQQVDLVRKKVISASIYPALLLAVGTVVALFLLGYVVPRFSAVYAEMRHELPWLSQLLLAWGRFLNANAAAVALAAVAGALAAAYALSLARVRDALLRLVWRIPRLGERMHLYDLGRLYRTLGMLLRSGIPAVAALRSASRLTRPELQEKLAAAIAEVEQGRAMSEAMTRHGLTTPVAVRMLRVGERTGRMSELTERIAAYYEDDMARWTERFTRLFEPVLMLMIGAVIGVIVLLMYMPIFELAGGLQ
jgi:general secretion pathway protein F